MIGRTFGQSGIVGILGLALTLAACSGAGDAPPMGDMHGEVPAGEQMEGMQRTLGMQRHVQELDEMTPRLRQHIQEMRQLSPERKHERMGEHAAQVAQMLALMNRQMREMDMGMGMSDEQMGQMMGMSGQEHRQMMDEMQAIRADLEQLQTARPAEVRQRMPAHLDRLEQLLQMLEQSAEHMRST